LCEELVIADSVDPSKTLKLVFHARVLGTFGSLFVLICLRYVRQGKVCAVVVDKLIVV